MSYRPTMFARFLDWLYRDDVFMHEREWVARIREAYDNKINLRFMSDDGSLQEHTRRGVKP